jgi:hypothetical protein
MSDKNVVKRVTKIWLKIVAIVIKRVVKSG